MQIKASDRTYVSDANGVMRVLNYDQNGAGNSEIYSPAPIRNKFSGKAAENAQAEQMRVLPDETKSPLQERLETVLVDSSDNAGDVPAGEVKDA